MRRVLLFAIVLTVFAMPAFARRRTVTPGAPTHCIDTTLARSRYAQLLAGDGEYVYVLDEFSTLTRIPRNGGPTELVAFSLAEWFPLSMAVDDTNVYIGALPDDAFFSPKPGAILAVPKSGGVESVLVSGVQTPFDLEVDGTHLYWVATGTFDFFDQTVLPDGKIERARKDGSGRQALAQDLNAPLGLAIDGTSVYFGETGLAEGTPRFGVYRVAKSGGAVTALDDATSTGPLALDGDTLVLFGANETAGAGLLALPKSGAGPVRVLYEAEQVNGSIETADRRAYFIRASETGGGDLVWVNIDAPAGAVVAVADVDGDEFLLDGCAAIVSSSAGNLERRRR